MNPAIEHCLRASTRAPACDSVAQWWPAFQPLLTTWPASIGQAIVGGFCADRAGWAFAAGYQASLRRILPDLGREVVAAFCVTEEGGNRPRDILTRIEPAAGGRLRISGSKRWTTLGPDSTELLVTGAMSGGGAAPDPGRPGLRVVRIPTSSLGVTVVPMPPTRFVPEVPHARLVLDGVEVDASALLPGDGYSGYVKPFRTVEDIHVNAALLGYLLREARARDWPREWSECAIAALDGLAAIAPEDPASPGTHLTLTGLLHWTHRLYADTAALWDAAGDDPAAQRWKRDTGLFSVAGTARTLRATRAWERFGAAG